QELKEKLYFALGFKAKINDLKNSEYLIQILSKLAYDLSQKGRKNLVNEPRPYSKVRLCEKANSIFYFKLEDKIKKINIASKNSWPPNQRSAKPARN
ncbi:20524_t:CDS:2, partial [Gigaspora margarita]